MVSCYYLWYGAINKRQYTDKNALTLREFFSSRFHILKLLFLSIFNGWYFRHFVGTYDMLVGLNVPTNFQMYRQNSEKALLGGGGGRNLPPPPRLATLMGYTSETRSAISRRVWGTSPFTKCSYSSGCPTLDAFLMLQSHVKPSQ